MELNLCGLWKLGIDEGDIGEKKLWYNINNLQELTLDYLVPSLYWINPFQNSKTAWLKKEFIFQKKGKFVYLVFFGSDKGKVWLNGSFAGKMLRSAGKQVFDITNIIQNKNILTLKFEDIKSETSGLWKDVFIMEDTTVPETAKKNMHQIPKWVDRVILYSFGIDIEKTNQLDIINKRLPYLKNLGINTLRIDSGYYGDLKLFINNAHTFGLRVITTIHPGQLTNKKIIESWVKDFNIDGYYCISPEIIPGKSWKETIDQLRNLKNDLLMAAESGNPGLYANGFDLICDRDYAGVIERFYKNYYSAVEIGNYIYSQYQYYPQNSKRILYPWGINNIKDFSESSKDLLLSLQVIKFFSPGIPLICEGEEKGLYGNVIKNENFNDFENESRFFSYYKNILSLRKKSQPLNDHSIDSFSFNLGLSYFEIIRSSMGKKIHAVFDTNQPRVTIMKNGRKHFTIQSNF